MWSWTARSFAKQRNNWNDGTSCLQTLQPVSCLFCVAHLQAHVELDRSERLAGLASELQQQLATDGARQGGGNAGSGTVTAGRAGGSLPTSPRCAC